jgi:TonB family protein
VRDRVADVLAQRATLDRGAGVAIALSVLLHGGLTAVVVYAALHARPVQKPAMVSIQFAKMPAVERRPLRAPAAEAATAPQKPKIEDVKPVVATPPKPEKPPEKNTVPLSPFGRSTKKGSETPPQAPPTPAPQPPSTTTSPDVPVGGSGVAGLEGGDFPYTLYLESMHRRIGSNWFRPQVAAGASVVVYFRILRDGTIVESRVETSSGNPTFDRAALSAVRSSSPLTPLPFAYNGNFLGVHLIFK